MDDIYSEMILRNKNLIDKNGFFPDKKLNDDLDERYCFAAFCPNPEFTLSDEFNKIFNSLSEEYGIKFQPEKGKGVMHWSLLQILKFGCKELEELDEATFERYFDVFQEVFDGISSFDINYNKIITTPTSILMAGECSIDINIKREIFRRKLGENNLKIVEPHQSNIYHSTIFRFTTDPPKDFFLQKSGFFGKAKIKSIHLGMATWRMRDEEIFSKKLKFLPKNIIFF